MNITVAGAGYVGLSNSMLLAQHNDVTVFDIVREKVDLINRRVSPIRDREIEAFLARPDIHVRATLDPEEAFPGADYVIIATSVNYDVERRSFDTSAVESVIGQVLARNERAVIVIKSTVPVGYTASVKEKFHTDRIVFVPEFLREGKALYDNLHPARIIVGEKTERAKKIADLMAEGAAVPNIPRVYCGSTEAEAIKLFSNTYLAMRVAYFNEIDNYAVRHGLNTADIIRGMCLDPRIGDFYNNPSFGYGGYCLPKDSKQLLANFEGVPEKLIRAIVESNHVRKDFIAEEILAKKPSLVGVYRLTMKTGSDNFRSSAILGIMKRLQAHDVPLLVYEPTVQDELFQDARVTHDLAAFKKQCDVILANRMTADLEDVREKVYTRDLFSRD
ncbi:MAG: nucleotide sugar dehydrogenase [Succiniclasticum sp.]|jgi:UDPglucose 6-dehydrogenase